MNAGFVCDASALAALLLDSGPDGQWVAQTIDSGDITAPTLVTYETANVIRKHELSGQISADQAAQAHADLLDLAIELWPYDLLASRAWEAPTEPLHLRRHLRGTRRGDRPNPCHARQTPREGPGRQVSDRGTVSHAPTITAGSGVRWWAGQGDRFDLLRIILADAAGHRAGPTRWYPTACNSGSGSRTSGSDG